MYLQVSLKKIKTVKVGDNPFNPADRKVELYQTWQLNGLKVPGEDTSHWARQGFSTTGAPDNGATFGKGEERKLYDPKIAFQLPKGFGKNKQLHYQFKFHFWESDRQTEKVRALFTDGNLQRLKKIWFQDDEEQKRHISNFLSHNNLKLKVPDVLRIINRSAPGWIAAGANLIPLLEEIVKWARNNGDDYLGMHFLVFELKKEDGRPTWRINHPESPPKEWKKGAGVQELKIQLVDAQQRNKLFATYQCRVLD